ncbi:hypothetical protein [Wolbachia endosymbiont of Pentidionis agamae]|uniref:hypothetical protein n=1 Tax=Wolbachia endosymbiont of Pentidionis agamae TaxID=3110435 RepID=UPI0038CD696A
MQPYFEPKKTGRARKHDIRMRLRYVMRTGCQWRKLPKASHCCGYTWSTAEVQSKHKHSRS